uniref:J domain-containing protein n=1 Tax=Plectus sambesii TaxID=2011161 RepID=A0A914XQX4_9BILA
MASASKKLDFDPYQVLNVREGFTEKELLKAFREAALKWHPDKNLDNKEKAHDMFVKITQAFEILSDPAVRIAFDNLQKAKQAAQERFDKLDAKRRKLREELEKREAGHVSQQEKEAQATRNFEKEIERLRREGSKLLAKEKENIEREVHKNDVTASASSGPKKYEAQPRSDVHVRLRIKWKVGKGDDTNGGYNRDLIESIFSKYGDVVAVALSSKPGSAVVEFAHANSAVNAEALEQGLPDSKLTVSWLSGKPDEPVAAPPPAEPPTSHQSSAATAGNLFHTTNAFDDFEAQVLANMKRAQDRRNLLNEAQAEQDRDDSHIAQ